MQKARDPAGRCWGKGKDLCRNDRNEWEDPLIEGYEELSDLPEPFKSRWLTLKQQFAITQSNALLRQMERKAKNSANLVSHDNNACDSLLAVKDPEHHMAVTFFIRLNERLTALRPGDTLYKTQPQAFITSR